MNNIGIVICSDAGYLSGALATINSCRLSNPTIPIAFLDAGLSGMQREKLSGKVDRVVSISDELSQFDFLDHRRMNAASFGSLYADKAGFQNFVFIDSDALLLAPVEGFIGEVNLSKTLVGVAAGGVRGSTSRAS